MKRLLFLSAALIGFYSSIFSQVPMGFNYQAIARDASGNPIVNANLQVKIAVLSDSLGSIVYWEELFNPVTTNNFGLFTIVMGRGDRQLSSAVPSFSTVNWSLIPLFIRTQVNYQSGWLDMGTTRIWSVPYALNASTVSGTVPKLNISGTSPEMDSTLFCVRNNKGQIVFAVYNEGVRINVDDGIAKSQKGGFAIGGFGTSKSPGQNYMWVSNDSVRLYINSLTKTAGGFQISSYGSNARDVMLITNTSVSPSSDNLTTLGTNIKRWTTIFAVNGTISTSDLRYKKNISDIKYGLEDILKLKPVSFVWKDDLEEKPRLGLIAQDVEKVIGEVVDRGNDPAGSMGINYPELVPVLIRGIQDQQAQILSQKKQIESVSSENQLLKQKLQQLEEDVSEIKKMMK